MYTKTDMEECSKKIGLHLRNLLLCALPFFAAGVVTFILRLEIASVVCFLLSGAVAIFLFDMKLGPMLYYRRYLREIDNGISHRMAGQLMSIGEEPVYEDRCWFYEFIINIYEDLDPEGERLFLLDCKKERPEEMIGRDIALTYHGKYVLDAQVMEARHAED